MMWDCSDIELVGKSILCPRLPVIGFQNFCHLRTVPPAIEVQNLGGVCSGPVLFLTRISHQVYKYFGVCTLNIARLYPVKQTTSGRVKFNLSTFNNPALLRFYSYFLPSSFLPPINH